MKSSLMKLNHVSTFSGQGHVQILSAVCNQVGVRLRELEKKERILIKKGFSG